MGKKRQTLFVQVMTTDEIFQIADVEAGIQSALERGTIGFDAVKHLQLAVPGRKQNTIPEMDIKTVKSLPRRKRMSRSHPQRLHGSCPCQGTGDDGYTWN